MKSERNGSNTCITNPNDEGVTLTSKSEENLFTMFGLCFIMLLQYFVSFYFVGVATLCLMDV